MRYHSWQDIYPVVQVLLCPVVEFLRVSRFETEVLWTKQGFHGQTVDPFFTGPLVPILRFVFLSLNCAPTVTIAHVLALQNFLGGDSMATWRGHIHCKTRKKNVGWDWIESWPKRSRADRRLRCRQVEPSLSVHAQWVQPGEQVDDRSRVRHQEHSDGGKDD